MSKQTSILKILYPSGVKAEDICEVYETVLPKIRRLLDGVAIGYNKPPEPFTTIPDHVVEPITVESTSDISPQEIQVETVSEPDEDIETQSGDLHSFVETPKHENTDGWHEEEYNKCNYLRNGDDIVIRRGDSRIDTTWSYLCDFFEDLPDEVKMNAITMSGVKRAALVEFYEAHPNFACEICKVGVSKVLKKEDVRVNPATRSIYESGGGVAADAYSS